MMEEERKKYSDDEYHFSENDLQEDFSSLDETTAEEPAARSENKLRQFVIVLIGLFLAILAIYQLYKFFFPSKELPQYQVTQATSPQPTVETPRPMEPVATAPMPAEPIPQMEQVSQRLSSLESNTENNRSDINKLSSNVTEMQQTMAKIEQKINELSYNIKKMTETFAVQQAQIEEIKLLTVRPVMKTQRIVKYAPKKKYYVQAIVLGRAWLKSSDGHTITVGEGSEIPGYGRVALIDPPEGEVTTSSGEIFRYPPEDR